MILLFIVTYVFPLQARFYNTIRRTLINAIFMSVRHLIQTIAMLAVDGMLLVGVYFALFMVPQAAMLLLLFWISTDRICKFLLPYSYFQNYIPKEEETDHTSGLSTFIR